jgi:flagellar hook-length control protein FliK
LEGDRAFFSEKAEPGAGQKKRPLDEETALAAAAASLSVFPPPPAPALVAESEANAAFSDGALALSSGVFPPPEDPLSAPAESGNAKAPQLPLDLPSPPPMAFGEAPAPSSAAPAEIKSLLRAGDDFGAPAATESSASSGNAAAEPSGEKSVAFSRASPPTVPTEEASSAQEKELPMGEKSAASTGARANGAEQPEDRKIPAKPDAAVSAPPEARTQFPAQSGASGAEKQNAPAEGAKKEEKKAAPSETSAGARGAQVFFSDSARLEERGIATLPAREKSREGTRLFSSNAPLSAPRPEPKASPAPPPPASSAEHDEASVLEQVRFFLRPRSSEARFRLDPPELGSVSVKIALDRGELSARIVVERPEIGRLIESRLPELRAALERDGAAFARIEVASAFPDRAPLPSAAAGAALTGAFASSAGGPFPQDGGFGQKGQGGRSISAPIRRGGGVSGARVSLLVSAAHAEARGLDLFA